MKTIPISICLASFLLLTACTSDQSGTAAATVAEKQVEEAIATLVVEESTISMEDSTVLIAALTTKDSTRIATQKKNIAEKKAIIKKQYLNSIFLKTSDCCKTVEQLDCCCKDIHTTFDEQIDAFLIGKMTAQALETAKNDPLYNKCMKEMPWFVEAIITTEQKLNALDDEDDW